MLWSSSRGSKTLSFSVAAGILRLLLPHLPWVHRNVIKSPERTRNDAAWRGKPARGKVVEFAGTRLAGRGALLTSKR